MLCLEILFSNVTMKSSLTQTLCLQGVKLTSEQFNAIFTYYDKVGENIPIF